jgi:hypothetical protein
MPLGAEQYPEEGAGLDQGIAIDQLSGRQQFGQDRVFDRPEECRLHAEQEQYRELEADLAQGQRQRRQQHDADFGQLDRLKQSGLAVFVGELAARRREQEIGQDEDRGGDGDDELRATRLLRLAIGDEDDQRVLQ